jgi:hypothetical protein
MTHSWKVDKTVMDALNMVTDEKWCIEHSGVMAFWRTGIGVVNLLLTLTIALKIFGVI